MKTCTKCAARLPLRFFPLVNGKREAPCAPIRCRSASTTSSNCGTGLCAASL
jgi:hypothetical protein